MRSRRLVATLAIAAIASLGTGCANSDGGTEARTRIDLGPARHFAAFPLYFLGTRYRTYRLTSDGAPDAAGYQRGHSVAFGYGACKLPPGEGGCPYPVQVANYALCDEYPAKYGRDRPRHLRDVRGLPAAVFPTVERGLDKLELYSDRTTIVIRAPDLHAGLEIAGRLRQVNARSRPSALRPPRGGFDRGRPRACPRS